MCHVKHRKVFFFPSIQTGNTVISVFVTVFLTGLGFLECFIHDSFLELKCIIVYITGVLVVTSLLRYRTLHYTRQLGGSECGKWQRDRLKVINRLLNNWTQRSSANLSLLVMYGALYTPGNEPGISGNRDSCRVQRLRLAGEQTCSCFIYFTQE